MNPETPASSPLRLDAFAPVLDAAWKLGLFCSTGLYLVGLVISNLYAEMFGRYSLSLDRANYIVVGLLWGFLAWVGYCLSNMFITLWRWPVDDSFSKKKVVALRCISISVAFIFAALIFMMVAPLLVRVPDGVDKKAYIVLFFVVLGTGSAIQFFVLKAGPYFTEPGFSLVSLGEYHVLLLVVRYGWAILIALVAYAFSAFPMVPTAFGGGAMLSAEIFIKPEGAKALQQAGFSVGEDGSLGAWFVVAELPDAVVLTSWQLFSPHAPTTVWVRKENIEVFIYGHSARSSASLKTPR